MTLDKEVDKAKSRYQEDETRSYRSTARSLSIVDGASKQSRVDFVKFHTDHGKISPEKNAFYSKENGALSKFINT